MYAYIDETGNTGKNIFDINQPDFITAALISRTNFDVLQKKSTEIISAKIGEKELHGNDLGVGRIETIAEDLLTILKKSNARFFIARVEKRYIAVTKFFDTLFDSYENKAVPWHVYNIRLLRLLLVFKLASILSESVAIKFWESILESNELIAYKKFQESLILLKENIEFLPDKRSREIITNAVDWALKNPESIYLHINSKAARNGHLPNIAVFPILLGGIEIQSKKWKRAVREIVHDRQSQFQKILEQWHEIYSNARSGVIEIPLEKPASIRRVSGSKFLIKSSSESPGIQVIDVILWLFKKNLYGEFLPSNCSRLMNHVFKFGFQNDMSFENIEKRLENIIEEMNDAPLCPEDIIKGKELLEFAEKRRQNSMKDYDENKKKDRSVDSPFNPAVKLEKD